MDEKKEMRASDFRTEPVSPIGTNEVPGWTPQGPTDNTCPMPPTPSSDVLPGFTPQYSHQFRFWCQHILPLVYEQSLSYYEVLCKIASKLNEVIQSENALNDNMVAVVGKINELISKFDTFLAEVKAFLNCFEGRMDAVEHRMDQVEAELQSFETRVQTIVDQYTALVQQLQTQVQDLTALVNTFDGRITTNTTNIRNLQTLVTGLRTDLTALTARVQANETWIQNFRAEKYGYYDVTQGPDPFVGDGTEADMRRLNAILDTHKSIYLPKRTGTYVFTGNRVYEGISLLVGGDMRGDSFNQQIVNSTIIGTGTIDTFIIKDCFGAYFVSKNNAIRNSIILGSVLRTHSSIQSSSLYRGKADVGCDVTLRSGIITFSDFDFAEGALAPNARISADGTETITLQNCKLAGRIVLNNIGKQAVLENCIADGMELDSSMSRITLNNCDVSSSQLDFQSCKASVLNSRVNPASASGESFLCNDCDSVLLDNAAVGVLSITGTQGDSDVVQIRNSTAGKITSTWSLDAEGSALSFAADSMKGRYRNCTMTAGTTSNFSGGSYDNCRFVFQQNTDFLPGLTDIETVMKNCLCGKAGAETIVDERIPDIANTAQTCALNLTALTGGKGWAWKSKDTTPGVTHEDIRNFYSDNFGTSSRKLYPVGAGSDPVTVPINARFSIVRDSSVSIPIRWYRFLYSDDPNSLQKSVVFDIVDHLSIYKGHDAITILKPAIAFIHGQLLFVKVKFTASAAITAGETVFYSDIPNGHSLYTKKSENYIGLPVQGGEMLFFDKAPNSSSFICQTDLQPGTYLVFSYSGVEVSTYPNVNVQLENAYYQTRQDEATEEYRRLISEVENPTEAQIAEALAIDPSVYRPVIPEGPVTPDEPFIPDTPLTPEEPITPNPAQ